MFIGEANKLFYLDKLDQPTARQWKFATTIHGLLGYKINLNFPAHINSMKYS